MYIVLSKYGTQYCPGFDFSHYDMTTFHRQGTLIRLLEDLLDQLCLLDRGNRNQVPSKQ
jgi:hypothetical protein